MEQSPANLGSGSRRRRWPAFALVALLSAGVIVAAVLLLVPKKPSMKVTGVRIDDLDLEALDLAFLVNVKNPTRVPLRLRDIDFDMLVGGRPFTAGRIPAGVDIAPGSAGQVAVPVRIEHDKLLPLLKDLRSQAPLPFELTVRGNFDAGVNVPVTYTHRGQIYPSHAPKCELREIRAGKGRGLDVELVLAVTNPNDIDLTIEEIRGAVKRAGKTVAELKHTVSARLPAGSTVDVVVPIHIDVSQVAAALLARGKGLRFEGKCKLGEPAAWRKMLLGKS